jgi:hypothetical protein
MDLETPDSNEDISFLPPCIDRMEARSFPFVTPLSAAVTAPGPLGPATLRDRDAAAHFETSIPEHPHAIPPGDCTRAIPEASNGQWNMPLAPEV